MTNLTSAAKTADSTLISVNEILSKSDSQYVLEGINGDMSLDSRKAVAEQLRGMRDSILSEMNSQIGDQYLFSGRGAETPFTVDKDGNILYRGTNVDTGDTATLQKLASETSYVDIGIGLSYDTNGNIMPKTAYDSSMPGISVLGYGETSDGTPKNLCSLLTQIADKLDDKNLSGQSLVDAVNPLRSQFKDSYSNFQIQQQKIGANINSLSDASSYLQNKALNLQEKDNAVEFVDPATAILDFSETKMSYNAALQVGTQILQKTLMDFLT